MGMGVNRGDSGVQVAWTTYHFDDGAFDGVELAVDLTGMGLSL